MYNFRKFTFTDEEYNRCVAIHNAEWPDNKNTVESMKHNDQQHNKKYIRQRWMIETTDPTISAKTGGEAVGVMWTSEPEWTYKPGKYHLGFSIDPALGDSVYHKGELVDILMDHLMDFLNQQELKPVLLTMHGREDKTTYISYIESQGFKPVMREEESELNVMEFDPTPFLSSAEKAKSHGIQIYTLPELQASDPEWKSKLYDLDITILRDVPFPGEFTPPPIEEWEKMFTHPDFLVDTWFIATHEGKYVGNTNLWDNKSEPQKIYVGLTGVRREYRRQGIATAIKLLAIDYAKQRGCTRMVTENEENNPMFQINLQLGFKPTPGWLNFQKEL